MLETPAYDQQLAWGNLWHFVKGHSWEFFGVFGFFKKKSFKTLPVNNFLERDTSDLKREQMVIN